MVYLYINSFILGRYNRGLDRVVKNGGCYNYYSTPVWSFPWSLKSQTGEELVPINIFMFIFVHNTYMYPNIAQGVA